MWVKLKKSKLLLELNVQLKVRLTENFVCWHVSMHSGTES